MADYTTDPYLRVNTLNDENNGVGALDTTSLREAIQHANETAGADIITFDASLTENEPGTINLTLGELQITESVTIQGPGADLLTVDAGGNSRVFSVDDNEDDFDEEVTIDGLTISGGNTSFSGGGIFNAEKLTVSNSTISKNEANNGGGIYIANGSITLESSTVTGNSAANNGGGIRADAINKVDILNSVVSKNDARFGGGIDAFNTTLSLSNSTFSENTALEFGGGIGAFQVEADVINSTISNNEANDGGGISSRADSIISLINSTVSNNSAANDGGGIFVEDIFGFQFSFGSIDVNNSTITENTAIEGGGIFNEGAATITSTIIAKNTDNNDIFGTFTSGGNNLIGNGDGGAGFTDGENDDIVGTADSPIDPLLGSLKDNGGPTQTHLPNAGSPALNAGSNPNNLTTDQRGDVHPRDDGNGVDIGATECFLTGTRILTDKGEVAVEDLQIGDKVVTVEGKLEAIKWIGRQTREPNQVRNPLRGFPILIKAGALGNNLPHRDLYVSPDHAMFFEGVLINAGALVNDTSIIKTEPTETFTYHHVELENHALLLAEGASAESYLPQKEDRLSYDNGAEFEELYPHGSKLMLWPMDYPRISSWVKVPNYMRKKLNAIAEELGFAVKAA